MNTPTRRKKTRSAKNAPPAPTVRGSASELLPIESLSHDGVLVRSDGAFVRYLEVLPTNPLALDDDGCRRMTRVFTDLLLRVPAGMSVQMYAEASHVALDALLDHSRRETDAATADLASAEDPALRARAAALRQLAAAHAESLAVHAEDQAALHLRYLLVVPYLPGATGQTGLAGLKATRAGKRSDRLTHTLDEHLRILRDSAQHTDTLRAALSAGSMRARQLTGAEVADLLWSRFTPTVARMTPGQMPSRRELAALGSLDYAADAETATRAATRVRDAIATAPVDLTDMRQVRVGGDIERTIYVSRLPERTFYGWLLHAMQSRKPWRLSVHVRVQDRLAMRKKYQRLERRLDGVNTASALDGKRPDRDQLRQQAELEQLGDDELATGAETVVDVGIYQTITEPGPDPDPKQLAPDVTAAMRALGGQVDAGVSDGEMQQIELWRSSLPLGLDYAKRKFRCVTRNAADSVPFLSTSCGSPEGVPFAFADPGRTVENVNPFDRRHDNGVLLVFAKSGGGKTASIINLCSAAMTRGAQVSIIDRSTGHYEFLSELIPGAVHLELGDESHDAAVLNAWDVEDPAAVPKSKVEFLVRLHALLIGVHDSNADSYGLEPLERTLLALAIRETYASCAAEGVMPGESVLRATLGSLADRAQGDDQATDEEILAYRGLAQRITELCADGTYGHLFDRPTNVAAADAPLLVFNVSPSLGDDAISAAVLFVALEHIQQRVEARNAQHLARLARDGQAAGPFDGRSITVVEEVWKLVGRRATREWVAEQARRARHVGLCLVAISQQRSDLEGENGRALLDNSTMQLFLRQSREEVEAIAAALRLSSEEIAQIAQLHTEKGQYAQAYMVNGERGRGTLTIRTASHVYWTCTSDPHEDLPLRHLALTDAGYFDAETEIERSQRAWAALDLLADPDWHNDVVARADRVA